MGGVNSGGNMNTWLGSCTKKELLNIIQAARKINNNYKRMKDSTILKKIINCYLFIDDIIIHIDNPSEKLQLAAIRENAWAIKYIKKPSKEAQLAAVKQNGEIIGEIDNPSKEIQLAAVKQNGNAIYYIKKPSEEVQLAHASCFMPVYRRSGCHNTS